ncbi:MAG TPA: hypothetical protein PLF28_06795, partial [Agitococcus sp.]|nr:hypothetical protein [Agitococcus sp.]
NNQITLAIRTNTGHFLVACLTKSAFTRANISNSCQSKRGTTLFITIFHFEHGFTPFYDLRGYRLFVHISIVFNDFMFTKRANFSEMRKS